MSRDRIVRKLIRERFLVSLRSGEAFEGLLLDADPSTLHLADVTLVREQSRAPVDGDLFVPRADVTYLQRTAVR